MDGRDRRVNIRDVRDGPGGTLPTRFRSILEAKAAVLTGLAVVAGVRQCGMQSCGAGVVWRELPMQRSKAGVIFLLISAGGLSDGVGVCVSVCLDEKSESKSGARARAWKDELVRQRSQMKQQDD